MQEALRRDAARWQGVPFDAALHHATMRRIRALTDPGATRFRLRLIPAAAAGATLVLVVVVSVMHRAPPRVQPDVAGALASSHKTIAQLSVEPPLLFPAWASPTASMLEQPRIPQ